MKFLVVAIVALAVAVSGAPAPFYRAAKDGLEGRYIVVMKPHVDSEGLAAHVKTLFANTASQMLFSYDMEGFRGFSGNLTLVDFLKQRNHPDVAYIEQDQIMRASQSCAAQTNAEWGLDRISETEIFLDGRYTYTSTAGSGVDAYIVDTGILTTHNDFGGRAIFGANFVDSNNQDCNGHGTHVAGTVGGNVYGVAKKTTLIAVKVLNCQGSGTNAGVIAGVNYVTQQYQNRKKPSVANMSLGGGKSSALDAAVIASIQAGVTYAVAAGNENADACNGSPSGVATAISVGATTVDDSSGNSIDERASFSNFGKCVSLFAPGQLIKSAWIGSNSAVLTISGTSMASPHVAGAVAMYLSQNPSATPLTVKNFLLSAAGQGFIDLACTSTACRNSPNLLLYSPC